MVDRITRINYLFMKTIEEHLIRLNELTERGGKSLIVYLQKYPEIKLVIQEKTKFLDLYYTKNDIKKKIPLTQRLWHIFQDNYEIPIDIFTLKIQKFHSFTTGYIPFISANISYPQGETFEEKFINFLRIVENYHPLNGFSLITRLLPHIKNEIYKRTEFLNNIQSSLFERIWYILNNKKDIVLCPSCNQPIKSWYDYVYPPFSFLPYCSKSCEIYNHIYTEDEFTSLMKTYQNRKLNTLSRKIQNNKSLFDHLYTQTNYLNKYADITIPQRLYHYYNKTEIIPCCETCEKSLVNLFRVEGMTYPIACSINCKNLGHTWGSTIYDYTLPSKKIIKLRGYEKFAVNDLLIKYDESELIIGAKNIENKIGELFYILDDNTIHKYYPDIYIPKEHQIIEVKSRWTLEYNRNLNIRKQKMCLEKGFQFSFMIYNQKGIDITTNVLKELNLC